MRKRITLMLAAIFLLAASSSLLAEKMHGEAHKAGKATVEGTLVDMKCYFGMNTSGEKHAKCAAKCARSGLPMGVMKKGTSEVYTLLAPAPAVADYSEQAVRVTGTITGHVLDPETFEVQKAGKWVEVQLPDTM